MPAPLVKEILQQVDFDLSDSDNNAFRQLAKDFEVSAQAMAFRLANLGYLQLP